jgi:hypothetical protein
MITNTHALMDGIRKFVLSGAVPGLKNVVFELDVQPHTTGDTIHLPFPDAMGGERGLLLWRYYAEHELGHEDPVNAVPHWRTIAEAEKDSMDMLTKSIWNILSDHVQERNRLGEYVGRDDVLLRGRAAFIQDQLKSVGTFKDDPISIVFEWDTMQRRAWNKYLPAFTANMVNETKRLAISAAVDMFALKNERDCYEAAKRIRALFPEVPMERPKPEPKGDGSSDDSKGEAFDKLMDKLAKEYKKRAVSDHAEMEEGKVMGGISKADGKGGSFPPRAPEYYDLDKGLGYSGTYYRDGIVPILNRTNLPARLKSWLVGKRAIREASGYRSGRLDTGNLTRVLKGRDDVFRQREDVRAVNAAVFLLVDASGSMGGSTYTQAAASAVMLADALSACKAMVRVETFTEEPHRLVHGLIKNWDERYNQQRMVSRLCAQGNKLLNNSDGESVLWSYHQLRNVRADKKLLLVISDGAPAGDGPGRRGVTGFTREALKLVEADKSIRTIGLGINGHDASAWYKQCVNVRNTAELPAALLQIAKAVYE